MGHTDCKIGPCFPFPNKSRVCYLRHNQQSGPGLLFGYDCVERRMPVCRSVRMCFHGPSPKPAFTSSPKSACPLSPHIKWGTLSVRTSPWCTMGTIRRLFWGLGHLLSCPRSLRVPQVLQQALHHYALWYRGLNLSVCVCSAVFYYSASANISIL